MGNCQANLAVYTNPTSSGQAMDLITASKPSLVRQSRNGEIAKLVGRVIPTSTDAGILRAPLTGRPCVYYDVALEILLDGKWIGMALEAECFDFFLNDDHESLNYVCASNNGMLTCALASTMINIDLSFGTNLSKTAENFCQRHNLQRSGIIINPYGKTVLLEYARIRASECIVPIGAKVEVFGYTIHNSLVPAPIAITKSEAKKLGWNAYEKKLWNLLCSKVMQPRILLYLSQNTENQYAVKLSNAVSSPQLDFEFFQFGDEDPEACPEWVRDFQKSKHSSMIQSTSRCWYFTSFEECH